MWLRVFPGLLALCLISGMAQAAGPRVFATIDRSGWPNALDSPEAFDTASRGEILMFGKALLASEALDEQALKQTLGVKQIDLASLNQVRDAFWLRLLSNYRLASQDCEGSVFCLPVRTLPELRQLVAGFTAQSTTRYGAWAAASEVFHRQYLSEQLRLAALFPMVSSEIRRFSQGEILGDELQDRQFLLTFDDGPSARGGSTERLLEVLRSEDRHGLFFVLGSSFQQRLEQSSAEAMANLYNDQCVALHGWEHKSHSSWRDWQGSISRSASLVSKTLPEEYQPLFRPPYGQRRSDSATFFKAQGLEVMLWNIDSQDWSKAIDGHAASQRVQTLMLLWRSGVILFHDTHDKAAKALPTLFEANRDNGVQWVDCRMAH
ncbi:polysaccharide deacetylase family protein [Pseudomonas sp. MAFF 302046]|uniref:Polysaccharide deacetylase family protein n=1 Tax=Pseudomonas morbosilactucae TaxID=2938197 RepID=A0ABT0JKJ4_9PSED|nr:polysaccharide deacetylase family protein [Pseudomonas morbosilactucae]MCK9816453.1 polysaccharide deacetylase family protein [Pseudomonas morbosilactucae]